MSSRADVTVARLVARGNRFRRAAQSAVCCAALGSFSLTAIAQPDPSPLNAPSASRDFPKKLLITVVADERVLSTFQQRVSSWFSDGTDVRVIATSGVDEEQLLASSPTEVRAWIVPLSAERALLTFSSVTPPAAPRHLVREIRLQQGFDELGLERLASVTHSAFVALSEGDEGVERAQAERELGAAGMTSGALAPAPASVPAPTTPVTPTVAPPRLDNPPPERSAVSAEPKASLLVAAGYGVRIRGVEGVGHGPSLALGVQLRNTRLAFDLQLSGQYLFRTQFEADPFSASVQTTALRVQFGVEPRLRASWFGQALFGLGADLARISVSSESASAGSARLLPRTDGAQWRGAGELSLGVLRRGQTLDMGVYAQLNFALQDVRYSAQTGNGETLLDRPWLVQPGLSIQGRFRSAL